MPEQKDTNYHLILTNQSRTIETAMETSVKKLLDRRELLRKQRTKIDQELSAIDTALEIVGVEAKDPDFRGLEERYKAERPFLSMHLSEACASILEDCKTGGVLDDSPVYVDKTEVEHLLSVGGYHFKGGNPTNSIEVTLRRLVSQGKASVDKRGGSQSSKYTGKQENQNHEVEDSGTTKK